MGLKRYLNGDILSNRKQCIKSGIIYSDWTTINLGVHQGTHLELLIFVLYINAFSKTMKSEEVLQSADDRCIISDPKTNQCLHTKTSSIFQTDKYMKQTMLALNITEILVFSKKDQLPSEENHYNGGHKTKSLWSLSGRND